MGAKFYNGLDSVACPLSGKGDFDYLVWASKFFQGRILAPAHFRYIFRYRCHCCDLIDVLVQITCVHPILWSMPESDRVWEVGNTKDLVCIHQGSVGCTASISNLMIWEDKSSHDLAEHLSVISLLIFLATLQTHRSYPVRSNEKINFVRMAILKDQGMSPGRRFTNMYQAAGKSEESFIHRLEKCLLQDTS